MSKLVMQHLPPLRSHPIKITKEVLERAVPKHAGRCIVAEAVRLHNFQGASAAWSVHITSEYARFNLTYPQGSFRFIYPLPAKAALNVEKFDTDRDSVVPFSFSFDKREGSVRPVNERGPQEGTRAKNGQAKTKRPKTKRISSGRRCPTRRYKGLMVIGGV